MLKAKIIFALFYDLLLLLAVWFVAAIPFVIWQGEGFETQPMTLLAFQIYLLGVSYIYLSYFWLQTGQTPGLRTWKLRLVRTDNYLLTRRDATVRFVLSLFSIVTLGFGWVWLWFSKNNQSLHDQLAFTHIVDASDSAK
ncbi:RDD family protein [Thiomicrospira sp.]|uniref:RDD family protein n=1 Tax=Thiomicrospira sp. TaxID=935 RepID=UPI002F94EE6A